MKHFTIEELTRTNTGLQNKPTHVEVDRLTLLVEKVLDPLRELYGKEINVNSAYRCLAVNKKVGGSITSQHLTGEAADITCDDNRLLFELIRDNFTFDQLINEKNYSWIHVSYTGRRQNRMQILKL